MQCHAVYEHVIRLCEIIAPIKRGIQEFDIGVLKKTNIFNGEISYLLIKM